MSDDIKHFGDLVEVYRPSIYAKDVPAKINWSCIGAQDVEVVEDFIRCLRLAVKEAKRINRKVKP